MTEKEKMLAGELFAPGDEEIRTSLLMSLHTVIHAGS
jgi:hypothetical protein